VRTLIPMRRPEKRTSESSHDQLEAKMQRDVDLDRDLDISARSEKLKPKQNATPAELIHEFVDSLSREAERMMIRSDNFRAAIDEAVNGQELKLVTAIRQQKQKLDQNIELGLISVDDAKNLLHGFIERERDRFKNLTRLAEVVLLVRQDDAIEEFHMAEVLARRKLNPLIRSVFITDRITPRFDPPTASESAAIERFVAHPSSLQSFGRIVAAGMADVSQNITATFDVIERISAWLNGALESELSKDIASFQPWSIGSFQPRILVRAMETEGVLHEFVRRGFGVPGSKITTKDDWGGVRTLEQFLYKGFLHEVALSKLAETPPDVLFATAKFYLGSSTNDRHRKEATHTILMKGQSGDWEQSLAAIPHQNLSRFRECLVNAQWDDLSDFGEIIATMKRDAFITRVRASEHVGRSSVPRDFAQRFDRKRFYKLLDIDPSNRVLSTQVELKICEKILKIDLESDETFDGNTSSTGSTGDLPDIVDNIRERLTVIDKFTADNPGKPVSDLILELFSELTKAQEIPRVTAPETPPAKWLDDRIAVKGVLENPPDFIKRNYAPWLGKGLTRADVRRLDRPLSTALDNWLRRNPMPDDLDLPTLKEQNSRWIDRIEKGEVAIGDTDILLKHGQRLLSAKRRRE
jgi:hypothetical protein